MRIRYYSSLPWYCLAILLGGLLGLCPRAHAQSDTQLVQAFCTPVGCQNNVGPTLLGSASTSIVGVCFGGFEPVQKVTITILKPCTTSVILETSADWKNIPQLDDCGGLFFMGQVNVHGSVLDVLPNVIIYSMLGFQDCAGGVSDPPPAFAGC